MPERPDQICCPVCRATVFQPFALELSDRTQRTVYACASCTVLCLDPLALTRAYEDRPHATRRPTVDTPAIRAWGKINQRRRERG